VTGRFGARGIGDPNGVGSATPEGAVVPSSSIKDEKTNRKLRQDGASEQKAARIANASAGKGTKKVASRGGRSGDYDDMSKQQLYDRAKEVGIDCRSSMSKSRLVDALRNR
jgi:hypothetical protein